MIRIIYSTGLSPYKVHPSPVPTEVHPPGFRALQGGSNEASWDARIKCEVLSVRYGRVGPQPFYYYARV